MGQLAYLEPKGEGDKRMAIAGIQGDEWDAKVSSIHAHWNTGAEPFVWTATAPEIVAKVRLVQTKVKQLFDNNGK